MNACVGKPFSYAELRGRVAALLRRSQPRHGTRITRVGALHIHHPSRQVHIGETPMALSAKEFGLLAHLASDPLRVFTKDDLLRDVWGFRLPARHAHRRQPRLPAARQARRGGQRTLRAVRMGRRLPADLAGRIA